MRIDEKIAHLDSLITREYRKNGGSNRYHRLSVYLDILITAELGE